MQADDCSPSQASLTLNLTWYACFLIKPESLVKLKIKKQHYFKVSAPPNIPRYSQEEAENYFKASATFRGAPAPSVQLVSGISIFQAAT